MTVEALALFVVESGMRYYDWRDKVVSVLPADWTDQEKKMAFHAAKTKLFASGEVEMRLDAAKKMRMLVFKGSAYATPQHR